MIQPDLLAMLRCPKPTCRGKLELDGERLLCHGCNVAYPVIDDLPQLLIEEAQPLPAR